MFHPRATYRIQFHAGFGFDHAAELTGYLSQLGISHLYCSPYLQAVPGSQHGYDVMDPRRVNVELGGSEGHARMCAALQQHGMKQLLDVVPNHMAIAGPGNPWWWDVLENGPSSAYARYFDVDWEPPEARLRNSVLLPVLGAQYGRALESGEIQIAREGASFVIRYYDHKFPMAPRSLSSIFEAAAIRCDSDELGFLADALSQLPAATALDDASLLRRHRDKAVLGKLIARALQEDPRYAAAIDAVIQQVNQDHVALHGLLERQNFRLAYWRAAGRDLGYRRFFDINTLVGLRMEDAQVFADTHSLVLRWLASGELDGLRIDHIDGLRDPEQYLERLRKASPSAWLVVEKILEGDEQLPDSWPVNGTTGYDFLNQVLGIFVDSTAEHALTDFYRDFTGETADFEAVARDKKDLVMREVLGSDLNRLTAMFVDICEQQPRYRDFTRHELHEALKAVAIRLPVYRTYFRSGGDGSTAASANYVNAAIELAKQDRADLDPELIDFLRDILLLRIPGQTETELALRFQQFTGPVMAKAVEDTAFYCFNRFICLNEVGGDPGRFGTSVEEFFKACAERQRRWPQTLLATSTHDTKRSEDVRARLALLSEAPDQWTDTVRRWARLNQPHWNSATPDRNLEYLLYQTLVGAWLIEAERVSRYIEKAIREAKQHTSWTNPNSQYETAVLGFVDKVLHDREFAAELERFVKPLVSAGRINSLAQILLKLTTPGVPDLYQGSELWHFALVDPDNRQPVDYALRRKLLDELNASGFEQVLRRMDEGLPKLWIIQQTLAVRRKYAEAFGTDGSFAPMWARGARAEHAVAFCRGGKVITLVPRLIIKLADDWRTTTLEIPSGDWRNAFTEEHWCGGETAISDLLAKFPVCLLIRE
ncbi:MAG TPA: malto-oligosyltrehalose synthase [Candidatus Binataceae bacterium]|nr:malto-oligosyltrehalose synthase [Candidatus Binataceae bacterium]